MNRFLLTIAVSVVCSFATVSEAAVMIFQGRVTSANNAAGFLGAVPPGVDLSVNLTVTDGAGPLAAITSGTFQWIGNSVQFITGGSVTLTEGGVNDTVAMQVNTSAGIGLFNFTGGNFISGTAVNTANLQGLVTQRATTGFSFITNGFVTTYSGQISAVPEPSSCLALLGVVGAGAWRMRRARKIVK